MNRVLCLLTLMVLTCVSSDAQDFASRFMQECKSDTAVHCITISPKMMEKMMKSNNGVQNDGMMDILSKLKSTRIVETAHNAESYLRKAEDLMKRNSYRYSAFSGSAANENSTIYVRKRKNLIVELVMLHKIRHEGKFQIIDFTGNMDNEFISNLTRKMGAGR
jgi:hypothetical protein